MVIYEKDFKAIERVFDYVIKGMRWPVQKPRENEATVFRTVFAKDISYKSVIFCTEAYVYMDTLSPWQIRNFKLRAEKALPGRWYLEEYHDIKLFKLGFK